MNEEGNQRKLHESIIAYFMGKTWSRLLIIYFGGILLVSAFLWNSFLTDNYKEQILATFFLRDSNKTWWSGLSNDWKRLLLSSAQCNPISHDELTNSDFDKVFCLIEINFENKKIENLEPLCIGKFFNLKRIYKGENLTSLNGISCANNLIYLDIDNSKIDNITELYSLNRLKTLSVVNTKIPHDQIASLLKIRKNEIKIRK